MFLGNDPFKRHLQMRATARMAPLWTLPHWHLALTGLSGKDRFLYGSGVEAKKKKKGYFLGTFRKLALSLDFDL